MWYRPVGFCTDYVESIHAVPGSLIRVETVVVPEGRSGSLKTDITRWTENSNDDKLYLFMLRVYTTSRSSDVNTLKHLCLGLSHHSFIH